MNTTDSLKKLHNIGDIVKQKFILYEKIIYIVGIVIAIILMIASILYRHMTTNALHEKSPTLYETSTHNLTRLQSDETLKDISPLRRNIGDMTTFQDNILDQLKKNNEQRVRLSVPFDHFLHMLYLPSLNIWQDPFNNKIDTSLIGKKYIDSNPYGDIALINSWTNFFKDVGVVDSYNTITDIKIGKLTNTTDGERFYIPITVDFETPDKRSFLLLVNKISLTAYLQNISLINEFMFYLWETIKEEQHEIIAQYNNNERITVANKDTHEDKIIGYLLYDWIINDGENTIITQNIILTAISKTASCSTEDVEECLYKFRDKMRALPYLAYGVARSNINMVTGLKFFFQTMPPLIAIDSFSFEEKTSRTTRTREGGYKGSISIKVYGKDITNTERNNIANELGSMCFLSKEPMSIDRGIFRAERALNDLGQQTLNTQRSLTLNQILSFFSTVQTEYETLPNHRKTVRLFEVYRTLQENNLCDIIDTTINSPIEKIPLNPIGTTEITSDEIIPEETRRVIGDGNSRRDQELNNLFDEIENEAPNTSGENTQNTEADDSNSPQIINELNE